MNDDTAKATRFWSPGLHGRVALTMVAAVAAACVILTLITTAWATAQYQKSLEERLTNAMMEDVGAITAVLEDNPDVRTLDELFRSGWRRNLNTGEGEALFAALPNGTREIDPTLFVQWGFVDFADSLIDRQPDCVLPNDLEWIFEATYSPGVGVYGVEECGDYLVGNGYLFGEPGAEEGQPESSWVVVRAIYLPHITEGDPVPPLRATLLWVSAGVVGVAALLALAVASSVIRPVRKAGTMATAVAEGNLSVRIPVRGNDAVAKMSTAVNTMADRLTGQIGELERSNEAQRRFVSDVAHELRTPTSALLASAEALRDPETRAEAAEIVAPQLGRLASLTEDLLEISRMDSGHAAVVPHLIDVADLIAETIVGTGAEYSGPEEFALTADPVRLQAVLRNLVTNARQHGAPPVTVTLIPLDSEVAIEVHDAGPGVPLDVRDRVFDRFVRGDESRHGSSSGLGLAIAAENAHLLGGTLVLDDDGVTFRLTLPID